MTINVGIVAELRSDDAITVDVGEGGDYEEDNHRQQVDYSERSCRTFDDKAGRCRTVQQCYTLTKMHQQIDNLQTWILGTKGTCNYVEPTGRQVLHDHEELPANFDQNLHDFHGHWNRYPFRICILFESYAYFHS